MSDEVKNEAQIKADEHRARAHTDPAASPPGPPPETGTQDGIIETVTDGQVEPDTEAGEAMVSLLARRAALPHKVIDAIERGLGAKKWSWCKATNSRIYEDDHRAQMDAAKLYLEYVVGRPAERTLIVTNGKGTGVALDELMASAALRRALARKLENAEVQAFGKGGLSS